MAFAPPDRFYAPASVNDATLDLMPLDAETGGRRVTPYPPTPAERQTASGPGTSQPPRTPKPPP